MKVPFVDLLQQYHALKEEIDRAVLDVLESSSYILGAAVERFERDVCEYIGVSHAIGVNSGTDALLLSLVACGVGHGDEVITVSNSFFATAEAVCLAGAHPIFVDVLESTQTMDAALLERAITPRTRAIIPVHLYGQPADMDEILVIAERHGLVVIEDACQAIGVLYKGRRVGSLAKTGCFSFVPAKNLGCFGDGGLITTNDDNLARILQMLRDHGSSRKYVHERIGHNSRLDCLQAAVLSVKLKYLDDWNAARRRIAVQYDELLQGTGLVTPTVGPDRTHIYHLYVVRSRSRDELQAALNRRGVSTLIHYPIPIHQQEAFRDSVRAELPVTEKLAQEILSLPMWPLMSQAQVEATAGAINDVVRESHALSTEAVRKIEIK